MRDFSSSHEWLSINTATIRKQLGAEVPLVKRAAINERSAAR